MKVYFVYILSSKTGTLYIGVTNDLKRRITEHSNHLVPGFTDKYNISRLLYYEEFVDINQAIEAEKKVKKWSRLKKLNLVKTLNPNLDDLAHNLEISR